MPDIFTTNHNTPPAKTMHIHGQQKAVFQSNNHKTTASVTPLPTAKTDIPEQELNVVPGLFTALIKNPKKLKFIHQEEDEHILLFVRRHFATNIPWIIFSIVALFVPAVFLAIWQYQTILRFSISPAFIFILLSFYYLIIFGFAFYNYLEWFYNIGIVTQKRIMDIDFIHLSYINIAITQLPEVEDVIHKQKGFFSSFFDYGDVIAHTVAGKEDFVFEHIPNPARVVDSISKLIADR